MSAAGMSNTFRYVITKSIHTESSDTTYDCVKEERGSVMCPLGDHPCLSCKTHLDFQDKMTFDLLIRHQYLLTIIQNLEDWLYIFEFLIDGISQNIIYILFVKLEGIIDIFRYPGNKLVGTLSVPGLDLGYNLIALSESIWYPP